MKIVAFLFLLCGVALAGGAIYYAQEHFAMLSQSGEGEKVETKKVLTANARLVYGDVIDKEVGNSKLIWRDWPADSIPSGAFTEGKDFLGKDFERKRTVLATIEPGLPILKSMVSDFGEGVGLTLSAGMRAVTIPINAVTGGGGHISPNDRVDIEYTRRGNGTMTSAILLEDVRVIAVDLASDSQTRGPRLATTVTVEVNTENAQRLRLALSSGTLALLLRGAGEEPSESGSSGTTINLSDLPGAPDPEPVPEPVVVVKEPEPVAQPEDEGYRVRVRRGNQVEEQTFKD